MSSNQPAANSNGSLVIRQAGMGEFGKFIQKQQKSIEAIAASSVKPERFAKIVFSCVSRTPGLQNCTMLSVVRAALQAAELGLEPGSALGEAYLVPYGNQCQMIPGYRGLVSLAYRSGHILSISAREVYEDDEFFELEFGLEPKLKHIPGANDPDVAKLTHAYCVIRLKDGGLLYDVMTRKEIDRIRARSKSGNNGPWVTDYAEMAKKTVTRRTLKYAPMSVEMSKALAADTAADTGDASMLEFDGTLIDGETGEVIQDAKEQPSRKNGTDAIKDKLGVTKSAAAEEPVISRETYLSTIGAMFEQLGWSKAKQLATIHDKYGKAIADLTDAELKELHESLEKEIDG